MALLDIRDLQLSMKSYEGETQILHGIDLKIERGQIWGMVGETGSGKSLTGLSVSRLIPTPPGRYLAGSIDFQGKDLLKATDKEMRALRGRHIGMIFQDPTTNLNPAFRIGTQLIDVALHAGHADPSVLGLEASASRRDFRRAARETAITALDQVGIPNAASRIDDYAHQFSGGMRQRVLIAMAMIGKPDLLIADEPTTALDVSVQAQILRLIHDLVAERNIGVLLITHNLGVVAQICTHVAVMYRGRILESGPVFDVLKRPDHVYTQALLDSVPTVHTKRGELRGLSGLSPEAFV
ncbi:ABC transporter ATP-binding protein [Nitratireductor aquimarinus]|uniref:ABC transporter ATP-binding protein n=1 Tax=Nitratireductor aquimarinus TaxID=889300 RepID=UPI001A8F08DE|nr:ABC transporter ATP-binding protein [Nitratireductor aquimarinus]MBN8245753.1 ABC transporter ATP-binding protein [Nitratireductor aquimarinus]MBY6134135.1 ABC transporter ATP-binding protein [Nitratireductor aquimarinus]MCA1305233.1 ABC transporter ATP-binding protein [Nitratireductor aquimarinus]